MSRLSTIRTAVYNAILAEQVAENYSDNDFTLAESHLPGSDLKSGSGANVWVVGLGGDEDTFLRDHSFQGEFPIQIVLKQRVDPTDVDAVDALDGLLDELKDTCRTVGTNAASGTYHHTRNEALKDPTGQPLNFGFLREDGVFEGVFLAYFVRAQAG